MGSYLTIPGVVDSQELQTVQRDWDHEFKIVLEIGVAATHLWNACQAGSHIELLVLTIEPTMILALDDVYVVEALVGADTSLMVVTLKATEVRNF